MSADIQIVFDDIRAAARIFHECGEEYADLVPKEIEFTVVLTEDSLGKALSAALESIAVFHDGLGTSMKTYGDKLQIIHDRYRENETDTIMLLQKIDNPTSILPY